MVSLVNCDVTIVIWTHQWLPSPTNSLLAAPNGLPAPPNELPALPNGRSAPPNSLMAPPDSLTHKHNVAGPTVGHPDPQIAF